MRLATAIRIAELFSGFMLVLFALLVPMARWLVMAGYILAAGTAFYISAQLLVSRSAQVIAIVLALVILVPRVPSVVRDGIPVLPGAVAVISYSLALLLLVCQLFVLIVAVRALRIGRSDGQSAGRPLA
jgi:hypothetical protein